MKQRTKFRLGITLMLAAAFASAALAQAAFAQDTTGATGSTNDDQKVVFTWASTGEPDSVNPMTGYSAIEFYFWTASTHLPIDFGVDFGAEQPSPKFDGFNSGLVTDVQTSDDSMHFTYTIRDDLFWSDGEPLTAADVAYTLNLYKNNHAYLPQTYVAEIDGEVRTVDDTHIEFDTAEPTGLYNGESPYLYTYILPQHVWEQVEQGNCPDGADPCTPKSFSNVPQVGSGPFVMAEYKVGEFVRMERNPYWPGPKPAVDEIIYRIYKNDDAIATALQTGEIDFGYVTTPNVYNTLKNAENIDTMVGTIPSFSEIALNSGSATEEPEGAFTPHGTGHPALADPVVRRAIRMAIDSDQLNENVLLGYGVPGDTLVPPVSVAGARWAPTGADKISWDIPGANQLLEDAGYVDSDGDGIREMPQDSADPGRPLDFRYFVRSAEQTSVDAAPFISEWLQQIGIQTEVTAVNSAKLTDIINAGDYEMSSWGWYPDPDPSSLLAYFTCDQRPPDGSTYGNNDAYYCNPRIRRAVPRAAHADRLGRPLGHRAADAEDLLRRRCLLDHVVRPDLLGLAVGPVRGLHPAAAAQRRPARGMGRHQRGVALDQAGRGVRGRPARATPRGSRPSSGAILAGVIVLLVAVFLIRRRRAAEEDV